MGCIVGGGVGLHGMEIAWDGWGFDLRALMEGMSTSGCVLNVT
jgi:hypothetical protein